jgi:hypothetical protein
MSLEGALFQSVISTDTQWLMLICRAGSRRMSSAPQQQGCQHIAEAKRNRAPAR